jgi:hypothetical protein
MSGLRTRLERLEARVAEVRCVWLYVGWKDRKGLTAAGDGVSRVFVPVRPEALAPGLLVVLRHPDPVGAEVSAEAAHWVLKQLALSRHQRSLSAAARRLVLVTARDSESPPAAAAAGAAPPEAEAGSPPAAAGPPPPAAATRWPEWLPR